MREENYADDRTNLEIAIIGMAGRFPGAKNIEEFWQNVKNGRESITFFSEQELEATGIEREVFTHPSYVKARGIMEGVELFDAPFFNFPPREAELLDPQQRIFLECAWEALEHAGYTTDTTTRPIGIYAGASTNNYPAFIRSNPRVISTISEVQLRIATDKDYLATRASYKLNLTGPGLTVQTACSTSLVAVHLACQSLLSGECDLALAGGVSISVPPKAGYNFVEGGTSPDGHCRAFDAQGRGPASGSGVGIVVLKRLEDAVVERDHIHAVIKGSAINNDGSWKVGFTAPSVEGQVKVIRDAQLTARVHPRTISYIEAHGTGTPLGDPIEIAALTQAFRAETAERNFCAVGSVKTNIGHLDAASGIAGLIKTVMALKHRLIPPSLHFEQANPEIDFANSPFYVNTQVSEWKPVEGYRRAGVSSFGVGGTNAHLLLEEAPALPVEEVQASRELQIVLLSARTSSALEKAIENLVEYMRSSPQQRIADIAYTLQIGRKCFPYRLAFVCRSTPDALALLERRDPERIRMRVQYKQKRRIAFLFPGAGSQYVGMGYELYQEEPEFRECVDRCAEYLIPLIGRDLRHVLYPSLEQREEALSLLKRPSLTLLTLFVIEYALAQLWMRWGGAPSVMIGHSLGEYVAACIAQVFSLEDALSLVALRGQLFETLPKGAMLSVSLDEQSLRPLLDQWPHLALASLNGPTLCVISGYVHDIDEAERLLVSRNVQVRRIEASGAGHSPLVIPILETFTTFVKGLVLHEPELPYISNVTGTWITPEQATDPTYWARHLRQTVRFTDGVRALLEVPESILLEVGPGRGLSALVRMHLPRASEQVVLTSLPHHNETRSAVECIQTTLSQLWLEGASIDWVRLHVSDARIPLPTYPFERQRYWVEPQTQVAENAHLVPPTGEISDTTPLLPDEKHPLHYQRPDLRTLYVAPREELEQVITTIWQDMLGIEQIGVYDEFFELGGNSLLATQLILRLRTVCQIDLPLRVVFEAPTVARLVQVIHNLQKENPVNEAVSAPDWKSDAVLDPTLVATYGQGGRYGATHHRTIFVTGATGFLGSFLLNELLKQPQSQVYCLVRATSLEEGKKRIQHNLQVHLLWEEAMEERIFPVLGDLSQPLCGLSSQQFRWLAEEVDVIYHAGAWVNAVYPYTLLRGANVLGTQEILRLASQGKTKAVHFVSTVGIFSAQAYADVPVIYEDDPLTRTEGLEQGYTQSKWVADKLVMQARSRGIPASIYRPAVILGHSRSGVANKNDTFWRLIKSCIQLGFVPDRDTLLPLAPVDYVCQAIVHGANQPEALGRTFHLLHPQPVHWSDLWTWIRVFGYTLHQVSYTDWQSRLLAFAQSSQEIAMYPLLSLFADSPDKSARVTRFDCTNTLTLLNETTLVCPTIDGDLFKNYFSYFVETGFLHAPKA